MDIKLILMDIDNTLVTSDKKLSFETKNALIKAQQHGIHLALASGRPLSGMVALSRELEMDKYEGYLISYNGALVTDCQNDETLFNQAMSVDESRAVLNHLKSFDRVRPMIDKGNYMYVNNVYDQYITLNGEPFNVMEYESRGGGFHLCEIEDLAQFVDFPLNKILTTADPEYLQEHFLEMKAPFENDLNCMFTGPFFVEYTAKNIDKANAIEAISKVTGWTREQMIAFGDGHNDATMLQYVGLGIAMDNAVQDLKDIADDVTLSNNDDGIAVSLYKYIPELKNKE